MTAQIPVMSRGVAVAHAIVDDADYDRLSTWSWSMGNGYAKRSVWLGDRYTTRALHREVLGLDVGDPALVDHINRDRFDNRRANLRIVEGRVNALNKNRAGTTSRFYGVVWNSNRGKWQATAEGRYLGLFDDELDAAQAVIDHLRTVA